MIPPHAISAESRTTGKQHRNRFMLIPWQDNFLHTLLRYCLNEDLPWERCVFIFPHSRPKRYLTHLLCTHPKVRRPLIPPASFTVSELFSRLRRHVTSHALRPANLLDQVGALLDATRQAFEDSSRQEHPLARLEAEEFFPWGVKLANLFEECFSQQNVPGNIAGLEGEISPFAELLLEDLGTIYQKYRTILDYNHWTTAGYDCLIAATSIRNQNYLPDWLAGDKHIFICAFHALTNTEETLFRHLWENHGATVILHGDPLLAEGGKHHWSCDALAAWMRRWQSQCQILRTVDSPYPAPAIRCVHGFDLHSQLTELQLELVSGNLPDSNESAHDGSTPESIKTELPDYRYNASTGIILPDTSLLMPTLHHMPDPACNISMGYPLDRSSLFRLADTLLLLQENRRGKEYYWKDLIALLRHPYVKMLHPTPVQPDITEAVAVPDPHDTSRQNKKTQPPQSETTDNATMILQQELHNLEKAIREYGSKFISLETLLENTYGSLSPEELPPHDVLVLLDSIFATCLHNFSGLTTLKDCAFALEQLCTLLLLHGGHLWRRFPIDGECLYRLFQSLIPALQHCALSLEPLGAATLFSILRQLAKAERVPFDADPLMGTQVLGMLEARLLSFRRLYILNATDDLLPGVSPNDPLLPESLRPVLHLPDLQSREQTAAYTFFRLIHSAEETVLLWQEDGAGGGIQEQPRRKSRFIEELLWEDERNTVMHTQKQPIPVIRTTCQATPAKLDRLCIPITKPIRSAINRYLRSSRGISPTMLDTYLRCPVQFLYTYVFGLSSGDEKSDSESPLAIGNLLHESLQSFFLPYRYKRFEVTEKKLPSMHKELMAVFHHALERTFPKGSCSADTLAMLDAAASLRLHDYLAHIPPTTVLDLECRLFAPIRSNDAIFTLAGKLDRIDIRDGFGIVVDYKTGRLPYIYSDFWEVPDLWNRMKKWQRFEDDPQLLGDIGRQCGSVQLPAYIYLSSRNIPTLQKDCEIPLPEHWNAAFVPLGDTGVEKLLFPSSTLPEALAAYTTEKIPALLSFLLRHMCSAETYNFHKNDNCDWCSIRKSCIVCCYSDKIQ